MTRMKALTNYIAANKIKLVAIAIVWTVAILAGMVLFFFATPALEARFYPVLTKQRVEAIERRSGQVCWRWVWNKVRYAQPALVSWSLVVNGTAAAYPVLPRRKSDGELIRDPKPAPLGMGSNEFCAPLPPSLDTISDLTIRGQASYVVPHGLWPIWQELPEIPVPPI